ncbi:MAG: hypothetical protein IM553_01750 [Microcystis sp. M57BS1]|uniref:hypothetical protein n=1 Tax=unclassified Microcystis TaxID=2643300 RepID=UPI00258107FB|nr:MULTISPECIES: hypothetical protein [unclassified Microcystis]MCA2506308.1 hypothetical protein [Microcystis sp. M62BS1]MCA2519854.1 hypothetical protein [Microcystis sp. M63BS1]MCA2550143.1 hypothetical protein [Microcystis sp. M53BS1]MCA2609748.1 hypothetical protein [Microcystis sp. M27BS1]MCA2516008.1 hypothetical protein [Microcystis sp. M59BS1]
MGKWGSGEVGKWGSGEVGRINKNNLLSPISCLLTQCWSKISKNYLLTPKT